MNDGLIALLSALIGGGVTAITSYMKNKTDVKKAHLEGEHNTEGIYVQNMSLILQEYKEQVSGFRGELTRVKEEFEEFRQQHKKEVAQYRKQIEFLELQVEEKDERIEELEEELIVRDGVIRGLKGEI